MDSANKRIAKNTIYMYIRLFTTMVIGLYTSRLVLEILGVSDYGLFAVVGGVLAMFTFISSSLASATSRFLNTEMGKKDGDVNATFNINLLLHIILALIIFALAETVGLWYICNKLNVAPGKLDDAIFVYHVSMLTACLGIINSPYQSLFNAHERFKFTSILDIVNSFVRLGCILMLALVPEGGSISLFTFQFSLLRLYSIIFALTTVNTFVIFHWVAYRDWPHIIKRRFVSGWQRYKEVLSFGGWNMIATLAYMARSSGSDLILNSFFGTSMNGAFAIGKSVSSYTAQLSSNFDSASAPQIIQAYAAGDKVRYTFLAQRVGRINILLFELILFPLLIQLEFVLHLWLGNVPEGAVEFAFWNLLVCGMSLTAGGIFNIINASGKVKWFKINVSFWFMLCVPAGWLLFKMGFPAYSMLVLFLTADVIQRAIQLIMMKRIIGYDSWRHFREAYMRPVLIAAIMSIVLYFCSLMSIETAILKLGTIIISLVLTASLILYIGLSKEERKGVFSIVRRKL